MVSNGAIKMLAPVQMVQKRTFQKMVDLSYYRRHGSELGRFLRNENTYLVLLRCTMRLCWEGWFPPNYILVHF